MAITSNYWKEPTAITAIERSVCWGSRGKSSFNVASMWLKSFRNLNLSHDRSLEGNDICCFYVINLNKYGRIDTARRILTCHAADIFHGPEQLIHCSGSCKAVSLPSVIFKCSRPLAVLMPIKHQNLEWKCFLPYIIIAWPRCLILRKWNWHHVDGSIL